MKNIYIFLSLSLLYTGTFFSQSHAQWRSYYDGPVGANDQPWAMAIDLQGNVITTGQSQGTNTSEMATVKYSPSGQQLWAMRYSGLGATPACVGYDVITDNTGNVYVAGSVTNSSSTYQMFVIKYSSTGSELWSRIFSNSANGDGKHVLVDASGKVYLLGWAGSTYILAVYDASGAFLGSTTMNTNDSDPNFVIDNSGNAYISGSKYESAHSTFDYYFAKVASNHTLAWEKVYSGPGFYDDKAMDIKVDNNGYVYVTGYTTVTPVRSDYYTVKYSVSGDSIWARTHGTNGAFMNSGNFIFLDAASNIYVAGIDSTGTGTVKYNSAGTKLWRAYGDQGRLMYSCVKDSSNAIIYAEGSKIQKVNSLGIYEYAYNATLYDSVNLTSLAVNGSGNIFASGLIYHLTTANDYETIKYALTIGVQQISSEVPSGFRLEQNYPNPFNPSTNIRFSVPPLKGESAPMVREGMTNIKLVIYDLLGREIETLVNQPFQPGTYEVTWNASQYPSGVYFYQLKTDHFSESKRMVIVK